MLTVAKVTGGSAVGYAEYLEGKTTASELGDYYLKDGERVEAPGRWVSGAQAVGCEAGERVSGEALRSLMAVKYPGSCEPLRQAGAGGGAVAALDATFSAPKSVSAVWALADPQLRARIELAQERAVDRVIRYSLAQVAMVRERLDRDTVVHVKAQDVVATSWRHTTARAVPGQAPDPPLHSHVLLHAAVRRDGKLVAIDSRAWLLHRREVGAAYRTELAHGLARLGFGIERGTGRGGRYFEIKGVPQALIDRWSSRERQVKEAIENRLAQKEIELQAQITAGGPGADEARARLAALRGSRRLSTAEQRRLVVRTRSAKQLATVHPPRQTVGEHRRRGRVRAGRGGQAAWQRGAGAGSVAASAAGRGADRVPGDVHRPRGAGGGAGALRGSDRGGSARDAGAAAGRRAGARTPRRPRDDRPAERGRAQDGRGGRADRRRQRAGSGDAGGRGDGRLRSQLGGRLTEEQRQAVELASGESRLVVIEGQAGTGKSTVLRAIARAHQQAGRQILVTSTAGLAAQRLAGELTEAGVSCREYSTVGLITAAGDGMVTVDRDTTVIQDEATLASTRELRPLLETVERSGARLILVGDPKQSHAVGAGGLWPYLERIAQDSDAHALLTRNVRALDPAERRDQQRLRDGQHELAVRGYAARGRLHITDTQQSAEDRALDAAQCDRLAGKRTVVIAQTSNDHLDQLNARAQAIRYQDGQLGKEAIRLNGRPYWLSAGDEIQLRHTITHAEAGAIRNGTLATITRVDQAQRQAELRLADGREVTLDREQLERAQARLAYVQHPFPAQGSTTDTAHLIVAENVSREGSYVALTRAREQTHIYTSDQLLERDLGVGAIPELARRLGREETDVPSIDAPLANAPVSSFAERLERRRRAELRGVEVPAPEIDGGLGLGDKGLGWES